MSLIKDTWEADIAGTNFLEAWPIWLRWIVAIPFSILGYALLYWFIRIFRDDLGQGTFLGSLLVYVGSATIPIYLLYGIVPKHKNVLTIIVLITVFFIRANALIIDLLNFSEGNIGFQEVLVDTLPNAVSIMFVIFFIKIILNSFKTEQSN